MARNGQCLDKSEGKSKIISSSENDVHGRHKLESLTNKYKHLLISHLTIMYKTRYLSGWSNLSIPMTLNPSLCTAQSYYSPDDPFCVRFQ